MTTHPFLIRMHKDTFSDALALVEESYLIAIAEITNDLPLLTRIAERAQDLMVEGAKELTAHE